MAIIVCLVAVFDMGRGHLSLWPSLTWFVAVIFYPVAIIVRFVADMIYLVAVMVIYVAVIV